MIVIIAAMIVSLLLACAIVFGLTFLFVLAIDPTFSH